MKSPAQTARYANRRSPAVFLVAALAAVGTVSAQGASGDDVSDILWDSLNARSDRELKRALTAQGTDVIPELFDVLVRHTFPVRYGKRIHYIGATPLQEEAIVEVLDRMPRGKVFGYLDRVERKGMSPDQQRVAFVLLDQTGSAADVELLERVAGSGDGRPGQAARSSFREALVSVLERDDRAFAELETRFRRQQPTLLLPTVEALGRVRSLDALETLANLLGVEPSTDRLLLREIASTAKRLDPPFDSQVRGSVRSYLDHEDVPTRALAARAVAELEDLDSIVELIDCLEGHPAAGEAAENALQRLTRLRLGPEAEAWRRWHEAELVWWTQHSSTYIGSLGGRDAGEIILAVRKLSEHRIFRDRLTPHIVPLLHHRDSKVVLMAAASLGNLGAQAALPELSACLDHSDPDVRQTTCSVLRQLTGLGLRADPALWRTYLGLRLGS